MSTKLQAQIKAEKTGEKFVDTTLNRPKKSETSHYVRNADLREELIRCKESGTLSETAAVMFMSLANKLSLLLKYEDEMDREDCVSAALFDMVKYWNRYNPEITDNAFAYCTSIARNGFAKGWRCLEKMKFPDSLRVSLSDNIYSI